MVSSGAGFLEKLKSKGLGNVLLTLTQVHDNFDGHHRCCERVRRDGGILMVQRVTVILVSLRREGGSSHDTECFLGGRQRGGAGRRMGGDAARQRRTRARTPDKK
jgi:hypothetical protein